MNMGKLKKESSQFLSRDYKSIIEGLQDIVALLEEQLRPLVQAEMSVLVDVLHRPQICSLSIPRLGETARRGALYQSESNSYWFILTLLYSQIKWLIKHCEKLLRDRDVKLCVKVLQTLKEMMSVDCDFGEKGEKLRVNLLERYYGKQKKDSKKDARPKFNVASIHATPTHGPGSQMLKRAATTLAQVQCHLDGHGASNLVVDLIMTNANHDVFLETVELGIALLEGGNSVTQKSLFVRLTTDRSSEKFSKCFMTE
ncbi:ITPR3 [Bugula neritina]|uniref:ITPR3 n=1 Tax=Bugula neritina TaxID=10212 RepID=A0A7J7KJ79_BUGNE|nr:ITPR3 [Bugula neritina]